MIKRKKPLETNAAENVSDKLICESCGKEFSCGANVGECWCFAVEVKAETLAELRENFQSCLCRDCLIAGRVTKLTIS
jgi:hypothetical protein